MRVTASNEITWLHFPNEVLRKQQRVTRIFCNSGAGDAMGGCVDLVRKVSPRFLLKIVDKIE